MLGFLFRLFVLTCFVVWLAAQTGQAHLVWNDYALDTSIGFLAGAVLVLAAVSALAYRLWRFVWEGPRFWRLRQALSKKEKGMRGLGAGFVALAGGRVAEAGRQGALARRQMGETVAGQLLQAMAASAAGDTALAQSLFARLAAQPETAALGYRGLISLARQAGHIAEVDRLAQLWARQEPDAPYLYGVSVESAIRRRDWLAARQALQLGRKARRLALAPAARVEAALMLAMAEASRLKGYEKEALEAAEKAVSLAPQWLPARLVLIQSLMGAGHERAAQRAIESAWAKGPHPDLARFAKMLAPAKKPLEAYKKIEKLARQHTDHPVTQRALADAALDADLWGEARRLLRRQMDRGAATVATYRLLARLERREKGNEPAALAWLAQAADAVPDSTWLCSACGGSGTLWQPTCPHCNAFDRMEWGVPGLARLDSAEISLLRPSDSLLG